MGKEPVLLPGKKPSSFPLKEFESLDGLQKLEMKSRLSLRELALHPSLGPHLLLRSPFGFPATTLKEAPIASCWDFATTFLLVSASIVPKAHTPMKMDCPQACCALSPPPA